ncbi:MAG: hypothetical protein II473_00210, partial [Clostridia bacterium]|nr:hypothetical protein [Clostridia bacterium]
KNANRSGARTYCKYHSEEDAAFETTVISIDSIFNADTITVLSSGKRATDAIAAASTNSGVEILSTSPKYIRKNGSMKAFRKSKYACVTITSLGDSLPAYFGTEKDTTENINVKAIENTMKLALEAAYAIDG